MPPLHRDCNCHKYNVQLAPAVFLVQSVQMLFSHNHNGENDGVQSLSVTHSTTIGYTLTQFEIVALTFNVVSIKCYVGRNGKQNQPKVCIQVCGLLKRIKGAKAECAH